MTTETAAATAVFLVLVLLFTTSTLLLAASAQPPPASSSSPGCVDELVAFSPCLSYVSAPPNNMSETAASECCDTVSSVLNSSNGNCLCYLLQQPLIFSFPLNQTRVDSLPLVCNTDRSLDSICSSASSPALPPLRNRTDSENSKPSDSATGHHHHHHSAGTDAVQAPAISSPAQPSKNSSATFSFPLGNSIGSPPTTIMPSSSVQLLRGSFPTKQVFNSSWLFQGMLIFPIIFIQNIP